MNKDPARDVMPPGILRFVRQPQQPRNFAPWKLLLLELTESSTARCQSLFYKITNLLRLRVSRLRSWQMLDFPENVAVCRPICHAPSRWHGGTAARLASWPTEDSIDICIFIGLGLISSVATIAINGHRFLLLSKRLHTKSARTEQQIVASHVCWPFVQVCSRLPFLTVFRRNNSKGFFIL